MRALLTITSRSHAEPRPGDAGGGGPACRGPDHDGGRLSWPAGHQRGASTALWAKCLPSSVSLVVYLSRFHPTSSGKDRLDVRTPGFSAVMSLERSGAAPPARPAEPTRCARAASIIVPAQPQETLRGCYERCYRDNDLATCLTACTAEVSPRRYQRCIAQCQVRFDDCIADCEYRSGRGEILP